MFKLKIITINVNSIISNNKRQILNSFLNDHKPDIVLITETKLKPIYKLSFKNYKLIRADRLNKPGGGCAILIKKKLNLK